MKRSVLVLCLGLMAIGCSKQKPVVKQQPLPGFLAPNPQAPVEDFGFAEEMEFVLVRLKRVHFALDSATLTTTSREALTQARELLVQYPDVHLYVEGHADSYGSSEYNISLAEKRATAVCDYLAALGMRTDHLHVVSWGEEKPLVAGAKPEAHAMNRRVEFRLKTGDFELHIEEGEIVAAR